MHYRLLVFFLTGILFSINTFAQLKWRLAEAYNKNLPPSVRLFYSNDSIEGKPSIAYYIEANLNDAELIFDTDTTYKRRFTPQQFYEKNNQPLVVVNGTFFSFETNSNLNVVVKHGLPVAYNVRSVRGRGKDSVSQMQIYRSAIGIGNGKADVAWIHSDSSVKIIRASQQPVPPEKIQKADSGTVVKKLRRFQKKERRKKMQQFKQWPVITAIGGGPVLLQNGEIKITNEEEMMFTGRAINDRHPRTAMGYTKNGKLIILVIQGRFPGLAEGASLIHEAQILKNLGCVEALNLDGGGSSCMLVNGIETIKPSDKTGQRAVPAVFIIRKKG
jgi:Phosphodiester glycosidase